MFTLPVFLPVKKRDLHAILTESLLSFPHGNGQLLYNGAFYDSGWQIMIKLISRCVMTGLVVMLLSGCGSIISRTFPGQGHGNQYYPGVQWDVRDTPWRFLTIIDLPLSLVVDTLLLPVDANHGPYE